MSAQGSQKENNGEAGDDSTGMPAADVKFLIECLKNTTGGTISVDMIAVAEALEYKNHRSVGNRILALKKKYNLPISTTKGGAKATGAGDEPPSTPKTEPTKNKVTKRQAPTKTKKAAAKKVKSVVKKEIKSEDEGEDADIEAEEAGEASSEKSRHDMTADEELDMLARTDSESEEGKYEA